jgi:hypothetical protein
MTRAKAKPGGSGSVLILSLIFGAVLLAAVFLAMGVGSLSPLYQTCSDTHSGRMVAVGCSFYLLQGGVRDYLIFVAFWLCFLSPIITIRVLGWWQDRRLAPRRERERERRAARRALKQANEGVRSE